LILIAGFIHDVSDFIDEHPGGSDLLLGKVGKDATAAFFGGFYNHSNAAHNVSAVLVHFDRKLTSCYIELLSMKRVGVLHGGLQMGLDEKSIPPSRRLRIMRYNELNHE
jgi:stearoyl-CoA desaturase (delta-9 desaturase)